jgi:hypothetical protein
MAKKLTYYLLFSQPHKATLFATIFAKASWRLLMDKIFCNSVARNATRTPIILDMVVSNNKQFATMQRHLFDEPFLLC